MRLRSVTIIVAAVACCASVRPNEPIRGMVGLGTWATQAEFKDLRVTSGDRVLFNSDFTNGTEGWKVVRGKWEATDGVLRQTSDVEGALVLVGEPDWSDYTVTFKARKTGGNEGFLIAFGVTDPKAKSWWNVGGWGNKQHAIESPGVVSERVNGSIETGRWYDVKVELSGNSVRAYLDNQLVQEGTRTPAQRDFGHALIPDLVADPSVSEIDGVFYLNATTDGAGGGLSTSGLPVTWKSKDFVNWSFAGSIFPANFDAKYWAPSSLIRKGAKYYLFPTLNNKITAVVADAPEGPFHALDGKDITSGSGWQPFPIKVSNPIDAEVFVDDDGAAYMVWSQRGIGKLKPDLSGFDGEQSIIKTKRGGYSEGPFLFKRNGVYYYLYTLDGNENYKYAYMMSRTSPLGPWDAPEQDVIATTDHAKGVFGPGHGCFFNPKGSEQWYFVYLEYGRGGTNRQVFADKLNFNADGTIQPVQLTKAGVGAIRADVNASESNFAQGKQATASSTMPDYRVPSHADSRLNRVEDFAPANALDGSNGSRWMARADQSNAWYQLDLGEEREIKRTELYFVKPTAGHAYRLESSLDGKTWQPYGGHNELIVQSPHLDAKAVRARYLKLTITRGTAGLWEFRVF